MINATSLFSFYFTGEMQKLVISRVLLLTAINSYSSLLGGARDVEPRDVGPILQSQICKSFSQSQTNRKTKLELFNSFDNKC